ncbi:hypothetical protein V6N13_018987 [Hibiscus sabdariffa]|uniref:Cyclin-dependent kinases regulatory subunit n=1 Tax=Hibiscus sabdariffa TaxID=183260 RepID=A0ABR2EKM4_9ROSI
MGQIQYSEKYFDDTYEYRHVVLPPEVAKLLPKNRLLSENEWRAIGVQQSRGWVHYAFIVLNHTSCCSGGLSTISSSSSSNRICFPSN